MLLPVCVSYRRARYSSHGWLTPAALVARRRFGEKCAICNAHTNVRKSGGRERAVVCDTNALLRELSTVRQSANTKLGAAGVSPPCARSVERCLRFVADHLQVRSPTHGWLTPAALGRKCGCRCWCAFHTRDYATHPTAGSRQPLLLRDADSAKSARYAMHTRTSAGAAGVSPPWGTIRTRCCESRAMFGDWRTHNQERRASARRGIEKRVATATVFCGLIIFAPRGRLAHHGWLTPAALGRRRGCFCRCAFHTRDYAAHPTAGSRQPLLVADADAFAGVRFVPASALLIPRLAHASRSWSHHVRSVQNATFAMYKRTCTQERRASARRGTGKGICNRHELFRTG